MKKRAFILIVLAALLVCAAALADNIPVDSSVFRDARFLDYVKTLPGANDGILTPEEITDIFSIDVTGQNISDLSGIEVFTALESLNCGENNLTALDVSGLSKLVSLQCYENKLTTLKYPSSLKFLQCRDNQLPSLNVDNMNKLIDLTCQGNKFTSLDVSKCPELCWLVRNERRTADTCSDAHYWFYYKVEDSLSLYVDAGMKVIAGDFVSEHTGWPNMEYINETEITVHYPEAGSSSLIDPKLTVPEGKHYWVEDAAWLLLEGGSGEMTFEPGGTYYLGFFLEAEEKYAFPDTVKVTVINGELNGTPEVIEQQGFYLIKGAITVKMPPAGSGSDPAPGSDPGSTPGSDPAPGSDPGAAPGSESGMEEQVTLKKIKISKVTASSKKKIKVQWKKLSKKVRKQAKRSRSARTRASRRT